MAVLGCKNGINIEINFIRYNGGYIDYSFRFLHGTEPLFNPAVMNKDYVDCDEYEDDTLIPFLEKIIDDNQSAIWHPLEPDLSIEIKMDKTINSYEVIFFIDPIKLKSLSGKNKDVYGTGCEPAVRLYIDREILKKFINDLKDDYGKFIKANNFKSSSIKNENIY